MLLVLAVGLLLGLFSSAIFDSDFWWHLATGRYIAQTHRLPVPDPFAYTTAHAGAAYPGEQVTRHFNLTHEWLSQVLLYGAYSLGGFAGVVLWRALLLIILCGLVGCIVWRRTAGFYRALAAAGACAFLMASTGFRTDRPYLISFDLLAVTLVILESRRRLWLLPIVMLFWANCHGGFFLGWLAIGAYMVAVRPLSRPLYIWGGAAILISGLNPNGFEIVPVLLAYRSSFLTSKLLEWAAPPLWPPQPFSILLVLAFAAIVYARRTARLSDWLLLAAFTAAALTAMRNIPLIAIFAPVVVFTYWPWKQPLARLAQFAAAGALCAGIAFGTARGDFFQLRAATWKYPQTAADFLVAHRLPGPIFNTYEWGGYLIWRLWPEYRVFIDGRALSENVFRDYGSILYNHPDPGRPTPEHLLDRYGIQTVIMNGFEYSTGLLYTQATVLAAQPGWRLVYRDAQALIFTRSVVKGVQPLPPEDAVAGLDAECTNAVANDPAHPLCARALGQFFSQRRDFAAARRWLGIYLSHAPAPDPEAEQAYQSMAGY